MHRLTLLISILITLCSITILSVPAHSSEWVPVTYGAELQPATFPKAEGSPSATVVSAPAQTSISVAQKVSATSMPAISGTGKAPKLLSIPSISLSDPIVGVGLTASGDMGVPSGKTQNIGWYQAGPVPGTVGSAVLDAHVFAAFSNLKNMSVGDDVYVTMDNGTTLHFRVTDMETYTLAAIPLERLFNDASGKHLNLITCAGTYIPAAGTYDHRLIVYTTLVEA